MVSYCSPIFHNTFDSTLNVVRKLTAEHAEKIFYFKKLIEILLPLLCVLNYYSLFFSFTFYASKIYQLFPASSSSTKRLGTDTLLCHKTAYNSAVISIKRHSVGERRVSLCGTLWFHIVPLFFIILLTVP